MEVGAVKQAFNNELILMKKKLNQAKIQTIHKLTRKAKTLVERKAPEQLKEKLKRKAESAVKEVLLIKKIKAKDIAKFIITHTGELIHFLNKPDVNQDKACARLVLHKAMQEKYKFIRGRFADVPIKDLFMSREERRKIKKEAREKQKNKKDKGSNKVVNAEGDWNVVDIEMDGDKNLSHNNVNGSQENSESENELTENSDFEHDSDVSEKQKNVESDIENNSGDSDNEVPDLGNFVKLNAVIENTKPIIEDIIVDLPKNTKKHNILKKNEKNRPVKKHKDINKNKNFNEKILQRKFKKDTETLVAETKVVDPFFITATGENYMSVAEPRQPDEFKEIHRQGNRKLRRAVMFGHVPKIKPRQNNFADNDKFNRYNTSDKGSRNKNDRFENKDSFNDTSSRLIHRNNNSNTTSNIRGKFNDKSDGKEPMEEKLHPSWEAKKRQSGILPFKGKKIVFDES